MADAGDAPTEMAATPPNVTAPAQAGAGSKIEARSGMIGAPVAYATMLRTHSAVVVVMTSAPTIPSSASLNPGDELSSAPSPRTVQTAITVAKTICARLNASFSGARLS